MTPTVPILGTGCGGAEGSAGVADTVTTSSGTRRNGLLHTVLRVASGTMHVFRKAVTPGLRGQKGHRTLISTATYSPWLVDEEFSSWLARVATHTLLDDMRLYELWRLAGQVAHLDGDVIEVGCWRGGAGCLVAARLAAGNDAATVFLCDTFEGVVKAGRHDAEYVGGEHADAEEAIVHALVQQLGLANVEVLRGVFPDESGGSVSDRRFKLAHIDVDVYQGAKDGFEWLLPRLEVGSIVVFDDYGFYSTDGVRRFVDELDGREEVVVVHNLNGQAVVVKRS